jgi:Uma2 family endonuclease
MNRMSLYEALQVPEVWRYDGSQLTVYCLENKKYQITDRSEALPQLTPSQLVRFLKLAETMGETSLIRSFREWVRNSL